MDRITCENCGREYESILPSCPECGHVNEELGAGLTPTLDEMREKILSIPLHWEDGELEASLAAAAAAAELEPQPEPEEPEEEPAEEAGPEAEPEEETEAEAPADNALEAVFDTPSEALSEVLAALPDQDAAQEIGAYFRGKTAQAESAGAKETVQVAYHKGSILSVTRTLKEGVSTTLRAETFHTATAGLFALADFFPGAGDWQDVVTAAAETVLADSTLELYDGWRDTLRSRFEPGQFYLEDGRLVVYYQPGVLTADITRAAIPFDQLKGFTLPG